MNKKSQMNEETKGNIITAFWSIYKNKDINKISVKEVIEKAGYNRSTFYYYFKNVQEILDYIENEIINVAINIIIDKDYENELTQSYSNVIIETYKKYGDYAYFLLSEKGDPAFLSKFEKATKYIFYEKNKKIKQDEQHFEILYALITSAFIGSFLYWYKTQDSIPIESFLEQVFKLSNFLLYNNPKDENLDKDGK